MESVASFGASELEHRLAHDYGVAVNLRTAVGLRPWERRVLVFLNAVRASLGTDSPEAFAAALQKPEYASALAKLHNAACAPLEEKLARLQDRLNEGEKDKASIHGQIAKVLLQMEEAGCDR